MEVAAITVDCPGVGVEVCVGAGVRVKGDAGGVGVGVPVTRALGGAANVGTAVSVAVGVTVRLTATSGVGEGSCVAAGVAEGSVCDGLTVILAPSATTFSIARGTGLAAFATISFSNLSMVDDPCASESVKTMSTMWRLWIFQALALANTMVIEPSPKSGGRPNGTWGPIVTESADGTATAAGSQVKVN